MEVLIDSDNSNASVNSDAERLPIQLSAEAPIAAFHQIVENSNAIDKLCIPCIGSQGSKMQ